MNERPRWWHCAQKLTLMHPAFRGAFDEFVREWGEDLSLPVSLFGHLGQAFRSLPDSIRVDDFSEAFKYIDILVKDEDELVGTSITTGFLEAMVHDGDRYPAKLRPFVNGLGPNARCYVNAYNERCEKLGSFGTR